MRPSFHSQAMNFLLWFLAAFSVVAVAVAVVLYWRLRKREAAHAAELRQLSRSGDTLSAALESSAIDQFLYDRCCRYMTERKPFLVQDFSLQDLANGVYTNKAYLSKTINQYSGKNFRQYVNYYRVMYSMELFRANMSLRVTQLGELSGFRSETSFFQSFKRVMGESPSSWCARMRKNYNDHLKN